MKQEWQAFLSAVQFLTRLPVPSFDWKSGQLDRSAKWFPMVGVIVGTICGLAFWIGNTLWSGWIAAVLTVMIGVIVTGALHEDGLADSADGIGGGRDKAKRLEIMRDSRIGSYGALALLFNILLKLGAITFLSRFSAIDSALVLIAAHTTSRAGMTGVIRSLPYARPDQAPLSASCTPKEATVIAVTLLCALLSLLLAFGLQTVIVAIFVAGLATMAMRWLLARSLGGWTGDGAGATQQVCETAFLLGVAAVWS